MPQKCKKPNSLLSGTKKRFRAPLNRILFTPVNFSVGPSLGGVLNKIFNQNRVARHGSRSWFNIRGHENPFFHRPVVNIQLVYHLPNTTGESRHAAEMQKAKQFAFRDQKKILGALNRILFTPGNISVGPSLGGVLNKLFNQNRVYKVESIYIL